MTPLSGPKTPVELPVLGRRDDTNKVRSHRKGESQTFSIKTIAEKQDREVVVLSSPVQLPTFPAGYESLSVLVIAGDYQMDAARNAAVREWVHGGGHLVLSVASERDAYLSSRFIDWVPCRIADEMMLRELSSLETYTKASARLRTTNRVPAVRLESSEGVTLASSIDGPILMRVPFGFGRVTMLGIDLNRPPLSEWEILPEFVEHISDLYQNNLSQAASDRFTRISSSNISDLSTQLLGAQERFPQIERTAIWMVIGWMVAYLVMIGFGDYLLVKYVFRRPEWTWFTLPFLVLVSVSLAAWGASRSNGNQVQVNMLDVIDLDAATQVMRVQNWSTLYSPETRRYRMGFDIPAVELGAIVSPETNSELASQNIPDERKHVGVKVGWYGTPESSFGGMYRTGGFNLTQTRYSFTRDADEIENLPIPIWSAKTLYSQKSMPATSLVDSHLVSTGMGQLQGTITHHFPAPLEDWFIAYGSRVFRPRIGLGLPADLGSSALPPGRPWDPNGAGVFQRELKGFLTGTIQVRSTTTGKSEHTILQQKAYDLDGHDAYTILKMMTFYEMVGGQDYTKLSNHQLDDMDLTHVMKLNRAVLFGQIKSPASSLVLDGKTENSQRHVTVVRIVLPVDQQLVERRELPSFDPNVAKPQNVFKDE
ncbi:MAG: DUF4350 domain-containing protein [Planctomycetota bacterium]|nr:DUF4350 domain-containing protein [Planctomycetota bacterium]